MICAKWFLDNKTQMDQRKTSVSRRTKETAIELTLNLDGSGLYSVDCPIGFFSHMLNAFCAHGLFDLSGTIHGDLEVDQHHLIEDTGITLGNAFARALGDCAGIHRSGYSLFPMDETLARAAVDFGGRAYLVYEADISNIPLISLSDSGKTGSFQTDTVADFWQGFVSGALCSLHIDILRGRSDHHKIEAIFKAAARAIRDAVTKDERRKNTIPSTKGIIV